MQSVTFYNFVKSGSLAISSLMLMISSIIVGVIVGFVLVLKYELSKFNLSLETIETQKEMIKFYEEKNKFYESMFDELKLARDNNIQNVLDEYFENTIITQKYLRIDPKENIYELKLGTDQDSHEDLKIYKSGPFLGPEEFYKFLEYSKFNFLDADND